MTRADNINILIAGKTREAVARLVPDTRPLRDKRQGMRFLEGFSPLSERPDGSHYRWSGPRCLLATDGPGPYRLRVENVTLGRKDRQTVYVVVDGQISQRVALSGRSPHADIVIDVAAHTLVELQSDHVFSPSWEGGDDDRVLSFTVDDPVATAEPTKPDPDTFLAAYVRTCAVHTVPENPAVGVVAG